jgi:hypothetical protein
MCKYAGKTGYLIRKNMAEEEGFEPSYP